MTAVEQFTYGNLPVRTVMVDGEPWFVVADVCRVLGIGKANDAVRGLDDDERGTDSIRTPSGMQEMLICSESGLFSLILRSRKPEARAFRRWVTHDVLPTIRRTGRYGSDADMLMALPSSQLLALAAEAAKRAEDAAARIALDAPKVLFADAVTASVDSILVARLANILKQNGRDIGQNRLFALLREDGYLGTRGENYNRPTQKAMDRGLFEAVERTVQNPDGTPRLTFTTKVTGKGQQYFINRYAPKEVAAP